jgi:type 1 glutamine amidotransferase
MRSNLLLAGALAFTLLHGESLPPEQKQKVDKAIPVGAPAAPRKPRRMLVTNLEMRDGHPWRGSSHETIPAANYAIEQMGKRTGAYEAVFSDDVEMFRPARIKQFDAICFLNTVGVLFEDAELKKSLLAFVASGKGFVGIHDAIATFVQYPKYDQWPPFGQMLGGTENGGHPWDGENMTVKVDDPASPLNAVFHGDEFQIADQAFQLQEPALRDHLHVLLSVDVEKTGFFPGHHILPVRTGDKDFPLTWIRAYGKGRVFYSSLGHGAPVFWNAPLLAHFLAGIQFALGDLKADSTPSARLSAQGNE